MRGPKLNTTPEVRCHHCQEQSDNCFPRPAGHTISDAGADANVLLTPSLTHPLRAAQDGGSPKWRPPRRPPCPALPELLVMAAAGGGWARAGAGATAGWWGCRGRGGAKRWGRGTERTATTRCQLRAPHRLWALQESGERRLGVRLFSPAVKAL